MMEKLIDMKPFVLEMVSEFDKKYPGVEPDVYVEMDESLQVRITIIPMKPESEEVN